MCNNVRIAKYGGLLCVAILFAIFMLASCKRDDCTCVPELRKICNTEEKVMVEAMEAPTFPISDTADCTVQLLTAMEKPSYAPDEPIIALVTIRLNGNCSWFLWASSPPVVDYAATRIVHEIHKNIARTAEAQDWLDSPDKLIRQCTVDSPRP